MFMTIDELVELTGYKTAKGQVAWLRVRGWRFETDRLDRPKVDRDYCKSRMGIQQAAPVEAEPNWAAL